MLMNMQNSNITTIRRQVYVDLSDEELRLLKQKIKEGGNTQQGFIRMAIIEALEKGQKK